MKLIIENMAEVVKLMDMGIFECPDKDGANRKEKCSMIGAVENFDLNKTEERTKRVKRLSDTRKSKQSMPQGLRQTEGLSKRKAERIVRKNKLENRRAKSLSELNSSEALKRYNWLVGSVNVMGFGLTEIENLSEDATAIRMEEEREWEEEEEWFCLHRSKEADNEYMMYKYYCALERMLFENGINEPSYPYYDIEKLTVITSVFGNDGSVIYETSEEDFEIYSGNKKFAGELFEYLAN